ncbi:hypothetical protein [Enterobacter kobei]|uniref:hypothetical protein n=1 Tax=Enterobacter kobei TaxID=208224 RepID=UPI003890D4C4
MSLAKLRMEYSYFKNDGHVMGVISDDFLCFWPILEALIITPKRRLAEKQQEKNVVCSDGVICLRLEEVPQVKER